MKKILLSTIISATISFVANAQISKGSVLLGGGLNISKIKSENSTPPSPETNQTNFSINPAIGIAIKENLVFGVLLSYGNSENTYGSPSQVQENDYSSYGGGVFLRRYLVLGKDFMPLGKEI
jgi:hypothetical protein